MRLAVLLPLVWCAGFLSTLGIGMVRAMAHDMVLGGGAIEGLFSLVVLGLGALCQVGAVALTKGLVKGLACVPERPGAASVRTLLLGGVGMIALNTVLVSGPSSFPPFGPVSVLLLCAPYPMAFMLLLVPRRGARIVVAVACVVLAVGVVPLRSAQERLAARTWLSSHHGIDRNLLRAVDWPEGEQGPIEIGLNGVDVAVFFQDTNIDGISDSVVTVSPPGTDPCGRLPVISDEESDPDLDPDDLGDVIDAPVATCTPSGPNTWVLSGTDFTGYAVLRDNVLLRISVDANRAGDDDLPVIARTLHPLDAHALWPYLSDPPGWSWLLE